MPAVVEQSTGLRYRGEAASESLQPYQDTQGIVNNYRAAMSYVTGATRSNSASPTAIRRGRPMSSTTTSHLFYRFNNGIPNQITAEGHAVHAQGEHQGGPRHLFAQDRWTIDR